MKRLEIGPGANPLPGEWDTLSCFPGKDTYCAVWGEDPLPISDATYDEVYASHVLEHIPWYSTVDALREVNRILVPGGLIELWVPNFRYIVNAYLAEKAGDDWRRYNPHNDFMQWVNGRIFTYGPGEDNWHKAVFDPASLTKRVREAGFVSPKIFSYKQRTRGASHKQIDLGIKARKPE